MTNLSEDARERIRRRILYAEKHQNEPTLYMNHYVEDMTELLRILNAIEQRRILTSDISEALS